MIWECELEFVDLLVGKVPKDPEALKYIILKRAKESGERKSEKEAEEESLSETLELATPTEAAQNTFYKDEKGFYLKPLDIIGMLKERARQLGWTTRKRGIVMALEGLKVEPLRIYITRNGKNINKVDGTVAKPIHKAFGAPAICISDYIAPPCESAFTIEKQDNIMTNDEFEKLLLSCSKLGGLRKEYGTFKWKKVKRIKP